MPPASLATYLQLLHILAPILPLEISTAATVCLPSVLACVLLQGRYFEAVCTGIDPVNKKVTACFPADDTAKDCFTLHYDMLVIGVSADCTVTCQQVCQSTCTCE